MQHLKASDDMTGSAKAAIAAAFRTAPRAARGGAVRIVLADEVDHYPQPAGAAPRSEWVPPRPF